jgi:hypothetical protein
MTIFYFSQIRDFPFPRLLWLAGLRWRYPTPPPHGIYWQLGWSSLYIRSFGRVRVRVTSRLAVYRQSVRLGAELLETHGQISFFQLRHLGWSLLTSFGTDCTENSFQQFYCWVTSLSAWTLQKTPFLLSVNHCYADELFTVP